VRGDHWAAPNFRPGLPEGSVPTTTAGYSLTWRTAFLTGCSPSTTSLLLLGLLSVRFRTARRQTQRYAVLSRLNACDRASLQARGPRGVKGGEGDVAEPSPSRVSLASLLLGTRPPPLAYRLVRTLSLSCPRRPCPSLGPRRRQMPAAAHLGRRRAAPRAATLAGLGSANLPRRSIKRLRPAAVAMAASPGAKITKSACMLKPNNIGNSVRA
jgi:hypothetical protein